MQGGRISCGGHACLSLTSAAKTHTSPSIPTASVELPDFAATHCRRSTASFRKKLFGHEQQEGYEDNIITQDMSVDYVRIHPLSSFKRYWDLAIVIMVAYTVVALPVRCAFSWDYYHALDAGHNLFHQLAVRCHTTSPQMFSAAADLCVAPFSHHLAEN